MRTPPPERKVNEMRARLNLLALALCALGSVAAAAPERAPGTKAPAAVSKTAVKPKPARTLSFDPLKIEGHVPRPKAIYTLERSRTTFGDLEPDDDFTPKILESVEGEPF